MKIPILGRLIDERFFNHRLRSTSLAGVISAALALCLFEYRYYINHIWSWDLLIVGATFVVVKLAVLTWYLLTD
jgi:hypothetical protein